MAIGKPISYGSFTINDRAYETLTVSPFYYIQVQSVDGLYGSDFSYESHPVPNAIGEKSGDEFRRGKTITLTGTIWARDMAALMSGNYLLMEMLAERSIKKLIFTPFNYGQQLYINCRPYQDLSVTEAIQETFGVHRFAYTFGLRADDPRSRLVSNDSVFPTF